MIKEYIEKAKYLIKTDEQIAHLFGNRPIEMAQFMYDWDQTVMLLKGENKND